MAPFLHAVPAATGIMTTLDPWHIPNWAPSVLHTIWPGAEQDLEPAATGAAGAAPAGAALGTDPEGPEVFVELVPERGGVIGDATGAFGEGEARIVAVAGVAAVPLGAPDDVGFAGAGSLDAGDEPELLAAPPAKLTLVLPGQVPCGGTGAELPAFWSTGPGLGNSRSTLSAVLHPSPKLATNISGNVESRLAKTESAEESKSVTLTSRFLEPPVTVMGAQFM